MTKQELDSVIREYYEHIYRRICMYGDFNFIPNEKEKKQISNFIDFLDKEIGIVSIGKEWVWNYVIYLFQIRRGQKTRYGNKIPLNWIIGKKSYELYEKRPEKWLWVVEDTILERGITVKDIGTNLEIKSDGYYEELREHNYKDKYPLHLCLGSVPYNGKSKICLRCVNRLNCKLING